MDDQFSQSFATHPLLKGGWWALFWLAAMAMLAAELVRLEMLAAL